MMPCGPCSSKLRFFLAYWLYISTGKHELLEWLLGFRLLGEIPAGAIIFARWSPHGWAWELQYGKQFKHFFWFTIPSTLACSKRSDSGERCGVKKAIKSRGGLLHHSPLSEHLEQATSIPLDSPIPWPDPYLFQSAGVQNHLRITTHHK